MKKLQNTHGSSSGALLKMRSHDTVLWLRIRGDFATVEPAYPLQRNPYTPDLEQVICEAVLLATCLYWKP